LVSGSGYLGGPLFPQITSKKPYVLMINWRHDTANRPNDDGSDNPEAHETCNEFSQRGSQCSLKIIPGSGHDIDFIEQANTIKPFLKTQLNL
jgi:hypothetical protein